MVEVRVVLAKPIVLNSQSEYHLSETIKWKNWMMEWNCIEKEINNRVEVYITVSHHHCVYDVLVSFVSLLV